MPDRQAAGVASTSKNRGATRARTNFSGSAPDVSARLSVYAPVIPAKLWFIPFHSPSLTGATSDCTTFFRRFVS